MTATRYRVDAGGSWRSVAAVDCPCCLSAHALVRDARAAGLWLARCECCGHAAPVADAARQ